MPTGFESMHISIVSHTVRDPSFLALILIGNFFL